jgi:hypothetical protein
MKASYTFAIVALVAWGLLGLNGYSLLESSKTGNVPGYPSPEQYRFYVYFPTAMLVLVVAALVASHHRVFRAPAYVLYALSLLVLPPFLLYYTGGM